MSSDNGFLSQEEIDALLNGGNGDSDKAEKTTLEKNNTNNDVDIEEENGITDLERDLLGEIGNISMGSASTALSTIINQQVNITTPQVEVTTLRKLKDSFEVPNIALEVKYVSGIVGENLLVMKITDALVIANLMMGGDGKVENHGASLSEIEESAVSEAMNQMIGSAATSMATMFAREVNISPPASRLWQDDTEGPLAEGITEDEDIIQVSFKLTIGELVDSKIMQILPMKTAKKIVAIMMGKENHENLEQKKMEINKTENIDINKEKIQPKAVENNTKMKIKSELQPQTQPQMQQQPQVNVQQANFKPLQQNVIREVPKNIDLILDVPLEISVVLGRTRKTIKDVLSLASGSLIELDKLAEEPVEILVNGKKVAYGEVVVVDENFGVRIVSIVSSEERVKTLRE